MTDSLDSASHVPPQEHSPPEHDCPVAHALQAAPPTPQSAPDWDDVGTQLLPLQQPVGHELESQMH